jgi:hypothetical protein
MSSSRITETESPNQTLDRMPRSAVGRIFQLQRQRRAPRHRSALRSAASVRLERGRDVESKEGFLTTDYADDADVFIRAHP